jgi:transposase-like protein
MTGRPSRYTAEIAARILAELSNDRTLRAICRDPGMPPARTVHQWLHDDREGFAARFRACRKAAGAKGGGPTVYSAAIADRILDELLGGRSLADVCRDPGMPSPSTVRDWADQDRDGFAARYCVARQVGYFSMIDGINTIGDHGSNDCIAPPGPDGTTRRTNVEHDRLRCTQGRLLMSKTLPRNYGDRPNLLGRLKAREEIEQRKREDEERRRPGKKVEGG